MAFRRIVCAGPWSGLMGQGQSAVAGAVPGAPAGYAAPADLGYDTDEGDNGEVVKRETKEENGKAGDNLDVRQNEATENGHGADYDSLQKASVASIAADRAASDATLASAALSSLHANGHSHANGSLPLVNDIAEERVVEFYLIRHAHSVCNIDSDRIVGRSSSAPLTEVGLSQARALGSYLKRRYRLGGSQFENGFPLEVYSSPAKRSYLTAMSVCGELGYPSGKLVLSEELHEMSMGDWEGLRRSDIYTPQVRLLMSTMHPDFAAPNGGESKREVETRMIWFLLGRARESFVQGVPFSQQLIVTHAGAIKCALRGILGMDSERTFRVELNNASVSVVRLSSWSGWSVVCLNDTGALA
eukprot:jgi/Chlat1/365/Chrsp10S01485